jgi:4-nitrophenyl phosphatase
LLQRAGCVNAIISGIISDLDSVAYRGEPPIRESVQAFQPQPLMIEQALAYLGTTKSETVMIGDQIGADIAAAQSTGLRSILVASDVPFNVVTGITPDHIVSSLLDLVDGFAAEAAFP